jgi:hypothetical protein
MAKRKKSKPKTARKRVIKPMATKRKKRRRKSTSVRRTLSSKPAVRRRRRKRGMFDGSTGLMAMVKHNSMGALGGALFLATRLVSMNKWVRTAVGFGGAVGLSYFKAPFVGAGMAGATAYQLGESLLPAGLLHDDLEDAEYVDANTLSDSGMDDENGYPIMVSENGSAYALNDNNELEPLDDDYSLQDGMQSVSMVPLQDAYSLSSPNGYALASGY